MFGEFETNLEMDIEVTRYLLQIAQSLKYFKHAAVMSWFITFYFVYSVVISLYMSMDL